MKACIFQRTKNYALTMLVCGSIALLTGCGGGGGGGGAVDSTAPVVGNPAYNMQRHPEGGPVDISVNATDESGIKSVEARITGNGLNRVVAMNSTGGSTYRCTWDAPANGTTTDQTYTVTITVTDNIGNAESRSFNVDVPSAWGPPDIPF
jgi:hypothetical protein